jgi:hypothetical protein
MRKPKPNPIRLKILMLKKGIDRPHLMQRFQVKEAGLSMAISGQRIDLHFKLLEYLKSCKPRKAA